MCMVFINAKTREEERRTKQRSLSGSLNGKCGMTFAKLEFLAEKISRNTDAVLLSL